MVSREIIKNESLFMQVVLVGFLKSDIHKNKINLNCNFPSIMKKVRTYLIYHMQFREFPRNIKFRLQILNGILSNYVCGIDFYVA